MSAFWDYVLVGLLGTSLFGLFLVTARYLWPSMFRVPAKVLAQVEVGRGLYANDHGNNSMRILRGVVDRQLRGTTTDPMGRMFELRQLLTWLGSVSYQSRETPESRHVYEELVAEVYPGIVHEMSGLLELALVGIRPQLGHAPVSVTADHVLIVLAVMCRHEEVLSLIRKEAEERKSDVEVERFLRLEGAFERARTSLVEICSDDGCSVKSALHAFRVRTPSVEQVGEVLAAAFVLANTRREQQSKLEPS